MTYGSLSWARHTDGELKGFTHWEQLFTAVKARYLRRRTLMGDTSDGFGSPDQLEKLMTEVVLPDSRVVRDCLALVTGLGPPAMIGHLMRTYAFGTLLGLRDGLRWDREQFALAALLHDLALSRRDDSHCCFAHDGAEQALTWLTAHHVEPNRRQQIADAICLHLRVEVPVELGVEAHLVQAGSGLDVIGRRFGALSMPLKKAVLERHPRGEVLPMLLEMLRREHRLHPTSRAGRWVSRGFDTLMVRNPLNQIAKE